MDTRPPVHSGARSASRPIPIRRSRSTNLGDGGKEEEDRGRTHGAHRAHRHLRGAHHGYGGYGRRSRHGMGQGRAGGGAGAGVGSRGMGIDFDLRGDGGVGAPHADLLSQSCPPRAPIVHSLPPPTHMVHAMPSLKLPPPSPDATSYFERMRAHRRAGVLSAPARSYMELADPRRRGGSEQARRSKSPTILSFMEHPTAVAGGGTSGNNIQQAPRTTTSGVETGGSVGTGGGLPAPGGNAASTGRASDSPMLGEGRRQLSMVGEGVPSPTDGSGGGEGDDGGMQGEDDLDSSMEMGVFGAGGMFEFDEDVSAGGVFGGHTPTTAMKAAATKQRIGGRFSSDNPAADPTFQ